MLRGFAPRLLCFLLVAAGVFSASPARAANAPPFFLYGATFFYERVPRDQWAPALAHYREMGVNTIDLYVMWNWHELGDGDFDFTGRTNPRRDLVGLLRLIASDGFHIVLRPGPVIRNEWRNGGYPAWLLRQAPYDMPLRDVLEGRYPATATLQNQHSDAAAQEWLSNRLHMRYATRWLQRVFRIAQPVRSSIFAVALDDDQGAYLDNDTWPGPHFHRYIAYLASLVHRAFGESMPVFINTYQMKVTASAPVWAWGNWYQSDAYSIGEHDRTQLEFSTGLLQTQVPSRPIMVSEFQAGWLQGADEAWPRAADPTNTTLALHTLLQLGAHGVVNFPVQDTLNPAGWEAPWTNAFYSWDAALAVQLSPQARYAPTARFGELMARYGAALVQTHPAADAAVAYMTSAYDSGQISNPQIAQIAQATMDAQRGCRIMRITCALVDLRYAPVTRLRAYRTLIVPPSGVRMPYLPAIDAKIRAYEKSGGRVVGSARSVLASPAAGGIPNAVLLVDDRQLYAFLDIVNYGRSPERTAPGRVRYGTFSASVPGFTIPPRDALLLPLGPVSLESSRTQASAQPSPSTNARTNLPLRTGSTVAARLRVVPPKEAIAYAADVYDDGYPAVVMENDSVRLIVSPCAGARAFVFEDKQSGSNLFTTIGGLRDAWLSQLPPSPRDYIAKYTHPIASGTFNRCYSAHVFSSGDSARASFAYRGPDAPPDGALFSRTIVMQPDEPGFSIRTSAQFPNGAMQRQQQLTSFELDSSTRVLRSSRGYGLYDPQRRRVVLVAWPNGGVEQSHMELHPRDALLTLTLAPGGASIRYEVRPAGSAVRAQAELGTFSNRRPSAGP